MATCGPSNPQQQLKLYVQRDASAQRETTNAHPQANQQRFRVNPHDNSAAEFAKFNSTPRVTDFSAEMNRFSAHLPAPSQSVGYGALAHHDLPMVNYRNAPQQNGEREYNWAAEFDNFRISEPQLACSSHCTIPHQHTRSSTHHVHSPNSQGWRPQFGLHPRLNSGPQFNSQLNTEPEIDNNAAFAAAFADAEASLQRLHANKTTEPEAALKESETSESSHATDKIAEQIMNTISTKSNPELTEKMKNSQFMNLMNKLKTNEVKLDNKETEFQKSDQKVDAYDLEPDSTHDWPPQRSSSLHSEFEQPPHVRAEPSRHTTNNRFSTDLDDPDTYQRKLRENLDPRLFQKSPYTSSFKEAVNLNRIPLKTSDWEENYDEWFA